MERNSKKMSHLFWTAREKMLIFVTKTYHHHEEIDTAMPLITRSNLLVSSPPLSR
jgi:hypothetical protein